MSISPWEVSGGEVSVIGRRYFLGYAVGGGHCKLSWDGLLKFCMRNGVIDSVG